MEAGVPEAGAPEAGAGAAEGGRAGGYPGFMGEYLVEDAGTWYAVEGSQSNALEASGGSCSADRATFDWAEFRCEAARFRFEFSMRVEALRYPGPPTPVAGMPGSPLDSAGDHTIAMAETSVDGARLTVVAWTPPPLPPPGPLPPDSAIVER